MHIDVKARREKQRAEIREDLVSAAHDLVKKDGYEGLTIRRLAERCGLATMSVYSYFPDKHAILHGLAEDTFAELARRCDSRRTPDALESLRSGMQEYVIFGLENVNEYQTIFMTPQVHEHDDDKFDELEAHNPAFQGLLNAVQECIAAGVLSGDARAITTMLWTVAHGAVSLIIAFPRYPFGDPYAYANRLIDLALDALTRASVSPLGDRGGVCC